MQNKSSLIKLIEAVKNHPALFKHSNEEQDNLKEWSAVAEQCKMTCLEAQDQWNLLLLQYVEYLRCNQDFSLAKYMDFLQPHFFTIVDNENIDERELLSALDSKIVEETTTPKVEQKNEREKSPHVHKKIKLERCIKSSASEESCIPNKTAHKVPSLPQDHLTDTKGSQNNSSLPQVNSANNMESQNNSSFTNLSSLELIFLGYAKQLQKMPLQLQLKTKRKIANIMDDAELEMMNS